MIARAIVHAPALLFYPYACLVTTSRERRDEEPVLDETSNHAEQPNSNTTTAYDVFISYSSKDQDWVHGPLLQRLEGYGLRVCIDFRDFQPGAAIVTEMERAVLTSRYTLLVLTPDFVNSSWSQFQDVLSFTLAHGFKQRRVIPLLKAACAPPLRIQALTAVDFTDPGMHESAYARLLAAIDPALTHMQAETIFPNIASTPVPASDGSPTPFNAKPLITVDDDELGDLEKKPKIEEVGVPRNWLFPRIFRRVVSCKDSVLSTTRLVVVICLFSLVLMLSRLVYGLSQPTNPTTDRAAVFAEDHDGLNTGVFVKQGDKVIFGVDGEWCWGPNDCSDANGTPGRPLQGEPEPILPNLPYGKLIGLVNNWYFPIGPGDTVVMQDDGEIILLMNDPELGYKDNHGQVNVNIENLGNK